MVPLAVPFRPTSRARPDIGLLDPPSVHVHLGERSSVAILSERTQRDLTARDESLQSSLCRGPTRLIHFRGIDVRQPHFLVVADERIAVDGDTALACVCGERT